MPRSVRVEFLLLFVSICFALQPYRASKPYNIPGERFGIFTQARHIHSRFRALDLSIKSHINPASSQPPLQEKYTEAVPLLERALSIRTKTLGRNHPDTVSSQNGLNFVRAKVRARLAHLVGKRHAPPIARRPLAILKAKNCFVSVWQV